MAFSLSFGAAQAQEVQITDDGSEVIVQAHVGEPQGAMGALPAPPVESARFEAAGYRGGASLLYSGGPLVTCTDCVGEGAELGDGSVLQNQTLPMNTLGFAIRVVAARQAQPFTVPSGGWQLDLVHTFAYETGSDLTSTMAGVFVQIWDGHPDEDGSTVVFGDMETNRMTSTEWSGIYRVSESSPTLTNRPIMVQTASVGHFLAEGEYWIEWGMTAQEDATIFAPPVTVEGACYTGNAWQHSVASGEWMRRLDTGAGACAQGFPIRLFGTGTPSPAFTPSTTHLRGVFLADGTRLDHPGEFSIRNLAGPDFNWNVVESMGGCVAQNLPWVSVSPASGTTSEGQTSEVSVTFDPTGLAPGTYTGELCIEGNSPTDVVSVSLAVVDDLRLMIPDVTTAVRAHSVFDIADGQLILEGFGEYGSVNTAFPWGLSVTFDGDGYYMAQGAGGTARIREFDSFGEFVGEFGAPGGTPRGIHITPDGQHLAVANQSDNSITLMDQSGDVVGTLIDPGANGLSNPVDFVFRETDILVVSSGNNAIWRFDLSGNFLDVFYDAFDGSITAGQMIQAANGNIILAVTSLLAQRGWYEFTPAGALVVRHNPDLTSPMGVHELPNGNLLVSNNEGVFELDRVSGNVVATRLDDGNNRFILAAPIVLPGIATFDPPDGLQATVPAGQTTTESMTIANIGEGDLSFEFTDFARFHGEPIFFEEFNDVPVGTIPDGWSQIANEHSTGTTPWQVATSAALGGRAARSNFSSAVPEGQFSEDYLITPAIELGADASLTFIAARSFSEIFPSDYELLISTTVPDNLEAFSTILTWGVEDVATASAGGTLKEVDLAAYAGQTVYLAFLHRQNDGNTFFLTDVRVVIPVEPFITNANPMSGTIAGHASADVALTFDSNGFEEGTYSDILTIVTSEAAAARGGLSPEEFNALPLERQDDLMAATRDNGVTHHYPVFMVVEEAPDPDLELLAYWNFNDPADARAERQNPWPEPIDADFGTGFINYNLDPAGIQAFAGTTLNAQFDDPSGDSFSIQGGPELVNNDKHFVLHVPTTGYEDVVVRWATRGTGTGFTTHTIEYSLDGGDSWAELLVQAANQTATWRLDTFDFSDVEGTANNPGFQVRVTLAGATGDSGNNRFDNITVEGIETDDPPPPDGPLAAFTPPIEEGIDVTVDADETTTATLTVHNVGDADLEFEFIGFADNRDDEPFFFEDFETTEVNELPEGWLHIATEHSATGTRWRVENNTHLGKGAFSNFSSAPPDGEFSRDYLVTPAIDLGSDSSLEFLAARTWSLTWTSFYEVLISTTVQDDLDAFVTIHAFDSTDIEHANEGGTMMTLDLSEYDLQTVYIAFLHRQNNASSLFVDDVAIYSDEVPNFVSDVSPASGTVAPGGSVDVTITFDAAGFLEGSYSGNLLIDTNVPATRETIVYAYPVTMNVVGEPGCVIEPDPIAFGEVIVGFDATLEASVTNEGTADCVLTGASTDEDDFEVDFTPVTLVPGASADFSVTFAPTSVGAITGTLTLEADNGEDVTAALTGTGLAAPVASVEPQALSFEMEVDAVASQSVTLSNLAAEGAADLEFSVSVAAARPAARPAQLDATGLQAAARPGARLMQPDPTGVQAAARGADAALAGRQPGAYTELTGGAFQYYRGRNEVTITHSASTTIPQTPSPIGCSAWQANPTFARDNTYWRVFDLSEFDIEGEFTVTSVDLGVWMNHTTNMPLTTVRLHALDGALNTANLTLMAETQLQITADHHLSLATATFDDAPSFAADEVLVVEWAIPDGAAGAPFAGHHTLSGQNAAGETSPTYFSTTECGGIPQPVTMASIGFPDAHWVLLVHGEAGPAMISVDPVEGSVAAGGSAELVVTVDTEDVEPGTYDFEVLIQTNDPDNPVLVVDVSVVVGPISSDGGAEPLVFALEQNYPNPFSGQTTIAYSLAEASAVQIAVYDVAGRRVATLVDIEQEAGKHAAVWDADGVASGVYFYRIQAGSYTQTLRALIVR